MEEKKINKKKKLTLTISSKKPHSVPHYTYGKQKKSVVIEKRHSRKGNERRFYGRSSNLGKPESVDRVKSKSTGDVTLKKSPINRNFEIRKIAEERATKGFKNLKENILAAKKGSSGKNKGSSSRREHKLTIAKALDDNAMEGRERSLASVRRARLKEKKNQDTENKKIETKKIVHEVNIPNKITIQELSNRMAMQASGIIKHLLGMGVVATINHTIDADTAEYLVKEFGNIPIREKKSRFRKNKS